MLGHVGEYARFVLKEADMAQLVHLIIADDHGREALAHVLHRVLTAGDGRDTGTRESDLAGGSEHEDAILIAVLLGLVQQHRGLDDFIGQVVHDVGLVPEDLEIRGSGLECGKAANGLIAVSVAIWVGVLRHAPDAFDGIILSHELLDHVHIGAVWAHRDADEVKAHFLGDGEVAVIAGHRAEELALLYLGPGARRILEAKHITDGYQVVHQLQAGVAAYKNFRGLYAKHIGKQFASLLQAFQFAIIAGVEAVIGGIVVHLQQIHRQIHLVRAGLTAGHVEFQAHVLKLLVLCFQRSFLCGQLVTIH